MARFWRLVASFTDAWIETFNPEFDHIGYQSHLLQMRGLKQNMQLAKYQNNWVASFTDAWIETPMLASCIDSAVSHLLQMRGLKPANKNALARSIGRIFYRCVD